MYIYVQIICTHTSPFLFASPAPTDISNSNSIPQGQSIRYNSLPVILTKQASVLLSLFSLHIMHFTAICGDHVHKCSYMGCAPTLSYRASVTTTYFIPTPIETEFIYCKFYPNEYTIQWLSVYSHHHHHSPILEYSYCFKRKLWLIFALKFRSLRFLIFGIHFGPLA